ncbi:DUF5672 family protein [Viscerimonas tarda]
MQALVKVIIPVYKTALSEFEKKALSNNLSVLSKHPVVFVSPDSLDLSPITDSLDKNLNISIEQFNDHYFFRGLDGYNELLLSIEFYARFRDTSYILICHTDAFVFRDELIAWCEKEYDYIGGPWIGSADNKWVNTINHILHVLKLKKKRDRWHLFHVGNGGFSLRKVKTAYKIVEEFRAVIDQLLSERPGNIFAVEDVFWSFKAKELLPSFAIPHYVEALDFAMDRKPAKAMKLKKDRNLPFGIHGLKKKEIRKYWEPIIEQTLKSKS